MKSIVDWIKNNKIEFVCLLLILAFATFFRFFKINQTFYFMGDAGRDAQAAYKIIFDHKFTLIGPKTSVGGFYLGPFYFYLITIPLLLFKMNPLGLGYMVSCFGVIATFLSFLVGRLLFDSKTGLVIALLYATSSIMVAYSRMAWNPSPVPLFTLLLIILVYLYQKTRNSLYMWLLGFIFGFGVQLHYNFICLAPPAVVYLLLTHAKFKKLIRDFAGAGLLMAITHLPLVIFEIRHQFITSKAFLRFLQSGDVGVGLTEIANNFVRLIKQTVELAIFSPRPMSFIFFIICLLAILTLPLVREKRREAGLLFVLFFLGAFCFSFFRGTLQLYYLNFLLPFPIILAGVLLVALLRKRILVPLVVIILMGYWANNWTVNINPTKPSPSLEEMIAISKSIVERVPSGQAFNIALFSGEPWHSAEEYRYFTYYFGKRALGPEDYRNIEKLFVISLGPMEDPLSIRSQETDDFGPREIEDSWEVGPAKIFRLRR